MWSRPLIAALVILAILASSDAQGEGAPGKMFSLEDVMKIAKMAGVAGPLEDVLKKTLSTEKPVETTTTLTPTLAVEVTRPSSVSTRRRTRTRITSTEPYQSRRFRTNHDPRRSPNLPSTRQTPARVPKVMYKASDRIRRRRPRRPVATESAIDIDPPVLTTELPSTTKIYSTETSTSHPITETTLAETILPTPENIVTEMTTMDKARLEEKRLDNTFNSIQLFLTKNLNSLLSSSRASRGEVNQKVVPWALSASGEKSRDQFPVTESTTVPPTISTGTTWPEANTAVDVEETIAIESTVNTVPPAVKTVETTPNVVIDETTIKKIQEATGSPNLDDIFGSMRQDLTKADFLNLLTTNFNIPIEEAKKLLPVATSENSTPKYTTQEVATFVNTDKPSTSTATVTTATPVTASPTTTTFTTKPTTATTTMKPFTPPPVTSRTTTVTTTTTATTIQPTSTQIFKKTNDVNIISGSLPLDSKKTPPPLLQRLSSLSKYSLKKLSFKSRPFKNPPSRDKLLRMLRDSNKKRVKLLSTYRKMGYHRVENYRKFTTTNIPITMGRTAEAIAIVTTAPSITNVTSQVISGPDTGLLQAANPPAAPRIPFIKASSAADINTLKAKSADSLSVNDLLLLLQMKINKVKPTKVVIQDISTTTATPFLDVQQKRFLSNSTGERRAETIQKQKTISTINDKTTTETPVVKPKTHRIKSKINVLNRDVFAKLKLMARGKTMEGKTKAPTSVTSKTTTSTTTSPTTSVPPTVPRVLSVLIRPQKRRMPNRIKQKKFLVTTTQTPTTQSAAIQDTPEQKINNKLTVNNFMSSLKENIHGLNSSKNLDAFEKKLEHILATSRRLRGRSHGTVHGGSDAKINLRKQTNNFQRNYFQRKRNNKSKITLVPKPQSTITTTQTPRQRPTTTYSQFSQDIGDHMQPTYQDIIALGQTNITALIKSIIRTSKQQQPNYVPQTQPIPDTTVPALIEPVPMFELSTPKTIHLSDIQISFKTNIPKSERLRGRGGGVQRGATTNHVKDTYKRPVHVHGGIDVQIQEVGETDAVAEPEPEPEAEPEPEPLVPRAGRHEKVIVVHSRIQDQGGPSIGPKPDVMAESETRPSADTIHTGQLHIVSDIYNTKTNTDINRMITAHQYTQTEIPPEPRPEHVVQDVHIQEMVSEPTVYGESTHGHTRTISLRNMQRNNILQTRVVPANSSPGRTAKGSYRVPHGGNEQGASARGPRVSSPRSMTSIFSSRPGIPTMEKRPRDPSVEEAVATDDSPNANAKSNMTSFDTKRSHLSSSQVYPGAQYSRHPSQEPSSPYIDIGRPSGIEHNFQTVGRTRASIRRREGRINNVPSHDRGNEPFPDVYGGMLMQRKHNAGVPFGSEGHRPGDVAQANRHMSPADQLTIGQSSVRPVQNHAGFKTSDVQPDSRRQPVLLSANPRASKLQQYQTESLTPPDSDRRSMQSSNRRYANGDFQGQRMQTVYDPESETYVTKPVMANSQSRRHQHADTRYQRNHHQQLHQQQQLHHQQQQQQQQYMRQQQMLMQENYNQEHKANTNANGHHVQRSQTRQSNDPYYQNQQHLGRRRRRNRNRSRRRGGSRNNDRNVIIIVPNNRNRGSTPNVGNGGGLFDLAARGGESIVPPGFEAVSRSGGLGGPPPPPPDTPPPNIPSPAPAPANNVISGSSGSSRSSGIIADLFGSPPTANGSPFGSPSQPSTTNIESLLGGSFGNTSPAGLGLSGRGPSSTGQNNPPLPPPPPFGRDPPSVGPRVDFPPGGSGPPNVPLDPGNNRFGGQQQQQQQQFQGGPNPLQQQQQQQQFQLVPNPVQQQQQQQQQQQFQGGPNPVQQQQQQQQQQFQGGPNPVQQQQQQLQQQQQGPNLLQQQRQQQFQAGQDFGQQQQQQQQRFQGRPDFQQQQQQQQQQTPNNFQQQQQQQQQNQAFNQDLQPQPPQQIPSNFLPGLTNALGGGPVAISAPGMNPSNVLQALVPGLGISLPGQTPLRGPSRQPTPPPSPGQGQTASQLSDLSAVMNIIQQQQRQNTLMESLLFNSM